MKAISIEQKNEELSLKEICERCVIDAETIIRFVDQGIVDPYGENHSEWTFTALGYLRIRKALRLQKDLALNDSGVALAIDLLERLQEANKEIIFLRKRLQQLEPENRM